MGIQYLHIQKLAKKCPKRLFLCHDMPFFAHTWENEKQKIITCALGAIFSTAVTFYANIEYPSNLADVLVNS